jgi:hypothetical protein
MMDDCSVQSTGKKWYEMPVYTRHCSAAALLAAAADASHRRQPTPPLAPAPPPRPCTARLAARSDASDAVTRGMDF